MSATEESVIVTPKMRDVSPIYAEILMLGNVLHASGYFKDVRDQAQAVTKILFGKELGFSPIVSISGIHVIEGKPALSSNLMATLIKRSGKYDYRVKTWSNTECVLTFKQKVDGTWEDVGESSFNMDDAKMAGVLRAGGSWSKYPKAMLFARALSQGLRTYCPDVSASPIYNPEEMGAEVNGDGDVTELPKSARPVAVTTESIPVAPPRRAAAVFPNTADGYTAPIKGTPEPQKAAVETPEQTAAGSKALVDALAKRMPSVDPVPVHDPDECIDLPEQRAIIRQAREATALAAKDSEVYFREYLKRAGYVDEQGRGSTKKIPRVLFEEFKTSVISYMRSLG